MKRRKIKKRYHKPKNALVLVALVAVATVIPTLLILLKDVVATKAASNSSSGRWISLGMNGVNVGAIAVSSDFALDNTLFINSSEGIFKSTNAGRIWVKLTNGLPLENPNYDGANSSVAISPNYTNDKTVFANTPSSFDIIPNGVYRSQDGGDNWKRVNLEFGESVVPQIAFSPNYKNDHTVIIGGDGDIPGDGFFAKSTDNGSTWQTLDALPDYSYWLISDFAFSPNYATDQTIFAAITVGDGISNTGGILKSTDRGTTWSLAVPFDDPGSSALAVAVSPNFANDHTVFAGTDATNEGNNLIRSADGGATWHLSSTGILTDDVQDILIALDGTLYAGTGGGGTLISYNFGNSWQPLGNFPNNNICGSFYSLAISPQYAKDATIFAACMTDSDVNVAGVWKHVLSRSPDRDFDLLSPFNNGVTWTVSSGYFNNRDQSKTGCHVGIGPDHCRNQLFGLDMVPNQQDDTAILSPGNGKVIFKGKLEEEDCIGLRITLDNGLNLNVCHFATFNVSRGDRIVRGKMLGARSTPHVHLSLDDRYRIGTLCPGQDRCFLPIPFDGQHTIEGMSLDPDQNGEMVTLPYPLCDERNVDCQFEVDFQQYKGTSGTSTNVAIP